MSGWKRIDHGDLHDARTYTLDARCDVCGWEQPAATFTWGYPPELPCPRCGCWFSLKGIPARQETA